MKDEVFLYGAILIAFALTLWIGWYTIIVILCLSIVLGLIYYYNEKKRNKRIKIGDAFSSSVIVFVIGLALVVICMLFKGCFFGLNDGPSYERIERRTKIHTSDGDKMPTMSEEGEYHNAGTGERQVEYGGSVEQKRDIEAADRLIENGF